jgi:hypothetical protein
VSPPPRPLRSSPATPSPTTRSSAGAEPLDSRPSFSPSPALRRLQGESDINRGFLPAVGQHYVKEHKGELRRGTELEVEASAHAAHLDSAQELDSVAVLRHEDRVVAGHEVPEPPLAALVGRRAVVHGGLRADRRARDRAAGLGLADRPEEAHRTLLEVLAHDGAVGELDPLPEALDPALDPHGGGDQALAGGELFEPIATFLVRLRREAPGRTVDQDRCVHVRVREQLPVRRSDGALDHRRAPREREGDLGRLPAACLDLGLEALARFVDVHGPPSGRQVREEGDPSGVGLGPFLLLRLRPSPVEGDAGPAEWAAVGPESLHPESPSGRRPLGVHRRLRAGGSVVLALQRRTELVVLRPGAEQIFGQQGDALRLVVVRTARDRRTRAGGLGAGVADQEPEDASESQPEDERGEALHGILSVRGLILAGVARASPAWLSLATRRPSRFDSRLSHQSGKPRPGA